jgi:hypothetical protein
VNTGKPAKSPSVLRRFGWLAALAVALAAYAFFYLGAIPQAWPIEDDAGQGLWQTSGADQMQLRGPKAGPLLSAHVGCAGNLTVRTVSPSGQPQTQTFSIAKGGGATVDIALTPDSANDSSAAATLEAIRGDPDYPDIRVRAQNASLKVDAYAVPTPGAPPPPPVSVTAKDLAMVFPCRQSDDPEGMRLDLGEIEDVDAEPVLHVRALALGQPDGDAAFSDTATACGAKKGDKIWRLPIPSVQPADCRSGFLVVSELKLDRNLSAQLQGSAYTVHEGKAHVWPFLDEAMTNPVLKYVVGLAIAGLVASVGFGLGRRRGGGSGGSSDD